VFGGAHEALFPAAVLAWRRGQVRSGVCCCGSLLPRWDGGVEFDERLLLDEQLRCGQCDKIWTLRNRPTASLRRADIPLLLLLCRRRRRSPRLVCASP
jgi:hypothetical protein